jgi:hypothetical protein
MGTHHELGHAMADESDSGLRLVRPWRLMVAHDESASTCGLLIDALDGALGSVDVTESSSVEDALQTTSSVRFDVALVCLDLPPAPTGGVRLAEALLKQNVPVVLVTRSLRWIPSSAVTLRDVPWVAPDADPRDVARAVREAVTRAVEVRQNRTSARPAAVTSRGR